MDTAVTTQSSSPNMDLIKRTFEQTQKLIVPLAAGAAVAAAVQVLANFVLLAGAAGSIGIMGLQMQQLQNMGDNAQIDPAMMGVMGGALGTVAMAAIFAMLVSFLISAVASAYYLIVYIRQSTDVGQAVSQASQHVFPLMGVWIVSAFRSLIWIPLVGFVFAIIWGPRMAFGPYIHVTEKQGINQSVSTSFAWTQGKWSQVVVPLFCVGLVAWIASAVVGGVGGAMVSGIPFAQAFVRSFCAQFATMAGVGATVLLAPKFKK